MAENRNVLYLFGYSEMTGKHLERLLPLLKAQVNKGSQIGLVLIHDGVIGINKKGKIPEKMEELLNTNINVYAMIPDLQARGIALENIHDKVKPIGYDDLIDILDITPKIISWM
ncbi:MAG: sulfurtransferase complex subunit TusB [Candidatus Lokiarchaeota archaeon]|nr:sulfurtransferase complex subunit TusB [Candidatus Lokiarchaeota archaeon]